MPAQKLVENPKNLPIMDADEDVLIEVAARDVRKATPLSPKNCAIAECSRRTIPGVVDAFINKSISYLVFKDKILRYKTPESAVRELISFDRGSTFAPGTYYLKRPDKNSRLDRNQKRTKHTAAGRLARPEQASSPRHGDGAGRVMDRGTSSMVERHVANVEAVGSTPTFRFEDAA